VQVKADISQAIAGLAQLGFHSLRSVSSSNPSYHTDCAQSATGGVRQFLTRYHCKEYTNDTLTARKQGTTAKVSITWVEMPTSTLAERYKTIVDKFGQGNPPGEPPSFSGFCYASGQNGPIVWAEQVQPTGNLNADREILQASAPKNLATGYLQEHCRL
jgi:hypothetical protein